MCNGGGGWGYAESIYRSNTLCISPDSEPIKLLHHPKQNLVEEGASVGMAIKYEGWKKRYRDGIHKSLFEKIVVLLLHFIQSGGNYSDS